MTWLNDAVLLRRYSEDRSEDAFNELVQRHLNLVYFAALRQTDGDAHLAKDIAQETFSMLVRKASQLHKHSGLAGWLYTTACYCAKERMRAEHRRRKRELSMEANDFIPTSAHDDAWLQVRPLIDDALQELSREDREAVLLHYFENRPFTQIGAELNLRENTARMRVSRALENVKRALAKRGVTSTSAALATVLTVPSAMAAPIGLAQQISMTALIAAAAPTGLTTLGILKLMTSTKLLVTGATLAVLAAIGFGLRQHERLDTLRTAHEISQLHEKELAVSMHNLEAQLAAEKKRAEESDHDNERLLLAITEAQRTPNEAEDLSNSLQPTHDRVTARYRRAEDLARSGQYQDALREYLWCYDTGMKQLTSFTAARETALLISIARLGKTYQPALDALIERRDEAKVRFETSATDSEAIIDYSTINRALGQTDKTFEVYNAMPPNDPRRQPLASRLRDELQDAHRYPEVIDALPYPVMSASFDITTAYSSKYPDPDGSQLRVFLNETSRNIEALAGAGDLLHAQQLMTKLLAFNRSPETRESLQKALMRAGHPELLTP